jgi:hypothetical protein
MYIVDKDGGGPEICGNLWQQAGQKISSPGPEIESFPLPGSPLFSRGLFWGGAAPRRDGGLAIRWRHRPGLVRRSGHPILGEGFRRAHFYSFIHSFTKFGRGRKGQGMCCINTPVPTLNTLSCVGLRLYPPLFTPPHL